MSTPERLKREDAARRHPKGPDPVKKLPSTVVTVFMCAAVLAGCTQHPLGSTTSTSPNSPGPSSPSGSPEAGSSVDPQVLNDAVAGVYLIPGNEQLRNMRVFRYIDAAGLTACGKTPSNNLNTTSARFDQANYADLELIAQKGLSERSAAADDGDRPEFDCKVKALPHLGNWVSLASAWDDVLKAAVQTPGVTATLPGVTSCLRSKSGFTVDATDPTGSYLDATDNHLSGLKTDAEWQTGMTKYSQIYVQCTPPYFDALKAELLSRRPSLIEQHRETLTAFAQDLVAAGYTP